MSSPAAIELTPAVYEFKKNASETIRASLSNFNGHDLAEVRAYFTAPTGELLPTRKGLTISRALLPELEAAVRALRIAAEAEGA